MRKNYFFFFKVAVVCLSSCSNSTSDKAQLAVKNYLIENLKNPESYEPISFGKLDTLKTPDTSGNQIIYTWANPDSSGKTSVVKFEDSTMKISLFTITHNYSIVNDDNEKVKMTLSFYLDKDLNINMASFLGVDGVNSKFFKGVNGDYSSLTGGVYITDEVNTNTGRYRHDSGASVSLYSFDMIDNLKYETICDSQGNFMFEKVLPGKYFVIVRSQNNAYCPESYINHLQMHSEKISQIFGFDLSQFNTQMDEINELSRHQGMRKKLRIKTENLIKEFPEEFKQKVELFTEYRNIVAFKEIWVSEGKTEKNAVFYQTYCNQIYDLEYSIEDDFYENGFPARIIRTGTFTSDDFSTNKLPENRNWFGLFKNSSSHYFAQTQIKIKEAKVYDHCGEEADGWEVETDKNDEAILLIKGLDFLTSREVHNVDLPVKSNSTGMEINSGDTIRFKFLDIDYKLFVTGHHTKKTKITKQEYEYNKLYLTATRNGKIQTNLLSTYWGVGHAITFAGDIDGDGSLDLIIESSELDYGGSFTTLYLSKPSDSNKLLKIVGRYGIAGGCCG